MSYMKDARGSRLDALDPLRDLPPVLAWYDFSTLAGADGTAVTRVTDKSGLGNDLVQSTTAYKPTKQTGSDGKAVVRFAANQMLACTTLGAAWPLGATAPAPVTLVVVAKTSSTNTQFPQLFGGTATGGTAKILIDAGTSKCPYLYGGTAGTSPGGVGILDDSWHTLVATADLSAAAFYTDGYLTAASGSIGTDGVKSLALGGQGTSTYLGDVRTAMVIGGRLRSDQLTALQAWLAAQAPVPAPGSAAAGAAWDQTTDANGTAIRIFAPAVLSTPQTMILWSHPAGATEQFAPSVLPYTLAHAAMARGWYFASTNQHADSWGSNQALTDLQALATAMTSRFGAFSKVVLAGGSMGGLATSLTLGSGTISNVVGAYLIDAVLSLAAQYGTAAYTAQIATAYGLTSGTLSAATLAGATSLTSTVSFPAGTVIRIDPTGTNPEQVTTGTPTGSGPYTIPLTGALQYAHASGVVVSDFPVKTAAHDPLLRAASNYATRLRFTASTSDTNVVKTSNTDAFRTLVATAATESGLSVHGSGHLAGPAFDPADFVAFVKRCIGVS